MTQQLSSPYLFIGGRGRIYALDKMSGQTVWQVELKKGWFRSGNDFVTLAEGADHLFAFSCGIAFCIEKWTGNLLWQSEIKRLRNHIASLAVDATLLGTLSASTGADAAVLADADGDDGDGGDGGGD